MTHYLLSVHSVEGAVREPMSEEQMRQMGQQIAAIEADLKSTGAWVFSGRMHEPDTATVVRESGGQVLTTDGPFVEAKEAIGGWLIYEADDLDAAIELAARIPAARLGGAVEVRPIQEW